MNIKPENKTVHSFEFRKKSIFTGTGETIMITHGPYKAQKLHLCFTILFENWGTNKVSENG